MFEEIASTSVFSEKKNPFARLKKITALFTVQDRPV
jgi:hypothetical protein